MYITVIIVLWNNCTFFFTIFFFYTSCFAGGLAGQTILLFLVQLKKTPSQILQKVFGDNTISSILQVLREKVKNYSGIGRPSTSRTGVKFKWLRQVICSSRRLTVRMIPRQLNIKRDGFWNIITDDMIMWEK